MKPESIVTLVVRPIGRTQPIQSTESAQAPLAAASCRKSIHVRIAPRYRDHPKCFLRMAPKIPPFSLAAGEDFWMPTVRVSYRHHSRIVLGRPSDSGHPNRRSRRTGKKSLDVSPALEPRGCESSRVAVLCGVLRPCTVYRRGGSSHQNRGVPRFPCRPRDSSSLFISRCLKMFPKNFRFQVPKRIRPWQGSIFHSARARAQSDDEEMVNDLT